MSTKRNPSAHVNSKISFEDSAEAVAGVKRAINSSEDGKDDVDVSENFTKRAHVDDDEAEDLSKLSIKTLKEKIEAMGGNCKHCIEKSDLVNRLEDLIEKEATDKIFADIEEQKRELLMKTIKDLIEKEAGVKRAMNSSEDGKDHKEASENITKRPHVDDDEAEDLSKLSMKTLNEYWAFVKDINWGKTRCEKVEFDSSKQRKKYDEITRYCANLLSTRIYDEEDERGIDLCYGGSDNHTYVDMPAEIVGRGRAFYNKMMKGSLEDIAAFGSTPNNVCENFSYLFYDLRD